MTFQFWWHFSFGDILVLVTFQFCQHFILNSILGFGDMSVFWPFSFGDISVFMIFQFWWRFSFGDISVFMTFQFWWHFSFGDILVFVTLQVWWHFSFSDLNIFRGLSNIAGSPVLQPNNLTNKQLHEYRAYPDFICWTAQCRNLWLEKHFSKTYLQNNDTYSISKI